MSWERADRALTQFDTVRDKPLLDRLPRTGQAGGLHELGLPSGKTEFYSLEIEVARTASSPDPKPSAAQEGHRLLRSRPNPHGVCDLCTGSGCIAVALAANCKTASIIATDLCDKALAEQPRRGTPRPCGRIKLL